MTDAERYAWLQEQVNRGRAVRLYRNGRDFLAECLGRSGYGANLGEAIDDLQENVRKEITARVARKLTA